jgi:hypothetical protein
MSQKIANFCDMSFATCDMSFATCDVSQKIAICRKILRYVAKNHKIPVHVAKNRETRNLMKQRMEQPKQPWDLSRPISPHLSSRTPCFNLQIAGTNTRTSSTCQGLGIVEGSGHDRIRCGYFIGCR